MNNLSKIWLLFRNISLACKHIYVHCPLNDMFTFMSFWRLSTMSQMNVNVRSCFSTKFTSVMLPIDTSVWHFSYFYVHLHIS